MYRISYSSRADRDLEGLPPRQRQRILAKIHALADQPRPAGVVSLHGRLAGNWRIRIGDHRVIYEIRDELRLVLILRIRDRREAYRD